MGSTSSKSVEKRLLKIRRLLKRKKPDFLRFDTHKRKKLDEVWRRPRGPGSKQRKREKSVTPLPEVGYRAPKKVRGLHPSGLEEVLVYNPENLDGLNPKQHIIKIASSVGRKKKVEIVEKALELGLRISNLKKPKEFLEEVKKKMELKRRVKEAEAKEVKGKETQEEQKEKKESEKKGEEVKKTEEKEKKEERKK
ncbi:50S ribosomal protein L32e [Nanoarchaeota archaeon]|nr:MAG: 50S ribosomal protein L32e [Nanoarchaeota archaeon]